MHCRKKRREKEEREAFAALMGRIFADERYKGHHVAVHPKHGVVAHGPDTGEVAQAVRDKGLWGEITFTYVPDCISIGPFLW